MGSGSMTVVLTEQAKVGTPLCIDRAEPLRRVAVTVFFAFFHQDEGLWTVAAPRVVSSAMKDVKELAEAIATAKQEATTPTEDYLLGIPLLADYLEDGLAKLGIVVDQAARPLPSASKKNVSSGSL